jgi:hypothetical protein
MTANAMQEATIHEFFTNNRMMAGASGIRGFYSWVVLLAAKRVNP